MMESKLSLGTADIIFHLYPRYLQSVEFIACFMHADLSATRRRAAYLSALQMFPRYKVQGIPVSQNVPCNMHINTMWIACIPGIPIISQFR